MSTFPSPAYPYPTQRVIVLRHGERRDNHPDAPAESNPPLTPEGVAAIQSTAARLKHYLGEEEARSAVLVVSPFLRTVQTAEALQHHGVGTDHAMVVDNTLCEVFGPSRIKTSRAPQLPAHPTSRAVGGLPTWGESLETATDRYVANFLRNGDVYGGPLACRNIATASAEASVRGHEELPASSSLFCPPAFTKRVNGGNNDNNNGDSCGNGSVSTPGSPDNAMLRNLKGDNPRDVILVTHGDAISAVLSHFYPARIVYEAEFLSFIVMRRYGPNNHVYHLDESAGVSWFVEGIDCEPQDPILNALEMEREATAAVATKRIHANTAANQNNCNFQTSGVCFDGDGANSDFNDEDEGDSLDEDAEGPAYRCSFAGSRMKPRTSRLPPRRVQPLQPQPRGAAKVNGEVSTAASTFSPSQTYAPLLMHPHSPAVHTSRPMSGGGGSSASTLNTSTNGAVAQVHTPRVTGSGDSLSNPRHHPKDGEGCERIRLPGGTPAQSSSNPVYITAGDHTDHRHGQSSINSSDSNNDSSYTSSRGSGSSTVVGYDGGGGAEVVYQQVGGLQCDGGPDRPLNLTKKETSERTGAVKWSDGKTVDSILCDTSSCSGLTADPSTSSCVRAQGDSISYFSAFSTGDKTVSTVLVPLQQPTNPLTLRSTPTLAVDPALITTPTVAAAVNTSTPPPRLSDNCTPTSTTPMACTISHNNGAVVLPAVQSAKSDIGYINCGVTPVASHEGMSFDHSVTSGLSCIGTVPSAPSEASDASGSVFHATTLRHSQRIDRKKAVDRATRVSLLLRLVCFVLLSVTVIEFSGHVSEVLYCVLVFILELIGCGMLIVSCQASYPGVVCVRRGVEQLRFSACGRPSMTGSLSIQDPHEHAWTVGADGHGNESTEVPFLYFHGATANSIHYESWMTWQVRERTTGEDGASNRVTFQNSNNAIETVVLYARHVVATAVKLVALSMLGFLVALAAVDHPGHAWVDVGRVYTTPSGLILTLVYGCLNVVRGVWDEARVDAVLDCC